MDTYRKPYAEAPKEHPRNFIIVGTTNEEEFLKDPTGNRRFWVIPVAVDKIDTELLQKEIEGIWASAINAYLGKQPWHLTELEEQARKRLNHKFQHSDEWENPIGDYLQQLETKAIASNTDPLVSIKELLKVIGQNADDRNSQHRVARILISMGWKKLGQRTINGLRQYVWTNPSILLNPAKDKSKDKQPKTTDIQGLSYPTYPTYPNLKTKVGEKHNTISEEENTSHETCKEVSSNKISRISRISNPSQSKASSSTHPSTQHQQGLSTQVVKAFNSSFTEATAKTTNEEKEEISVCDVAGIPLFVGDTVHLYTDYPTTTERLLGEILQIELIGKEVIVLVKWANGVKSGYECQITNSSFPKLEKLRKMVNEDERWAVATL